MTTKNVFVYADKGASTRLVVSTMQALKRNLHTVDVKPIMAKDVCDGSWKDTSILLVMPGGADLPYCKALNGSGNEHIREFVRQGGAYLGLCAGAYYASSYVCFGRNTPLHVEGERELQFFPGTAFGSIAPAFDYTSEAGAQATAVTICSPLCDPAKQAIEICLDLDVPDSSAVAVKEPAGSHHSDATAANSTGVECSNRVLQTDIWLDSHEMHQGCLLQCHPLQQTQESTGTAERKEGVVNIPAARTSSLSRAQQHGHGGAHRGATAGECAASQSTVASKLSVHANTEPQSGHDRRCGREQKAVAVRDTNIWSRKLSPSACTLRQGLPVVDYVNGGCCFLVGGPSDRTSDDACGSCEVGEGVTVVARYRETGRIAAAVTRPFGDHAGAGRAVMCGTHPEKPGEVLLGGLHLVPPDGVLEAGVDSAWYKHHLMQLHKQLLGSDENERRRELYFRLLLQHAGMQEFMTPLA